MSAANEVDNSALLAEFGEAVDVETARYRREVNPLRYCRNIWRPEFDGYDESAVAAYSAHMETWAKSWWADRGIEIETDSETGNFNFANTEDTYPDKPEASH